MKEKNIYQSTRNKQLAVSSAEAILGGIAPDGGLYTLPDFSRPDFSWKSLLNMDFLSMATEILCLLLPDFTKSEMTKLVQAAYANKFETNDLTPTVSVGDDHVLELFRGPTSAFKDVALSLLPHLLTASAEKCGCNDHILILTATSGDTGTAAMSGFCDVPGTNIMVFYPEDGVSAVQKAQMVTQAGKNVKVCAVRGNFDDAQNGVKTIFTTETQNLAARSLRLSSANSINIGRLAPQVVYYFHAYASLVKNGDITVGDMVDFSVPTGNFGDILAGYIARELGLPVGKLICASNANNVLTEFLQTGLYDRRRPFHLTTSPSMDILISSNLERLLYLESHDEQLISSLMRNLATDGHYQIPSDLLQRIQKHFWAASCNDEETAQTIADIWNKHRYLCDPHTAVAWHAAQQYKAACPDHHPIVVLSTASPYKFPEAVLSALGISSENIDNPMSKLNAITQIPIPGNLVDLFTRQQQHFDVIDPAQMRDYVLQYAEEIICKA